MKRLISVFLLILVLVFSYITPAFAALKGDVDDTAGVSASDARLILRASVKADQFPAISHNYNAVSGLSDPSHYEEIPLSEKWIVADNCEISIESAPNIRCLH